LKAFFDEGSGQFHGHAVGVIDEGVSAGHGHQAAVHSQDKHNSIDKRPSH
jgi:hypothetical protein